MKKNYILSTFLFVLGKCFAQTDSLPIALTLKIDKEYVRTYNTETSFFKEALERKQFVVKSDSIKQKFFDISLSIRNTANKAIKIWLMTCSWEDNFIVNNNYIFIKGHECDKNFPTLVEFKPGESKVYTTTLIKSIKFDYPCENCIYGPQVESTKLGLIILDDLFKNKHNMLSYDLAIEDKSIWKIIWSNPLYLLAKNESHPQPIQIPVYQSRQ